MNTQHVAPAEAAEAWKFRWTQPMALLDVRERWEYADEHFPGACPMPRGSLELQAPLALPDPRAQVFVYSAGDVRAELAAETLWSHGYVNTRVMQGGIAAWRASGLPIVSGWGTPGKRVGERIAHSNPDLHCESEALARGVARRSTLVIDVRPRWEHEQGHVPGAVNIAGGELPKWAGALRSAVEGGFVQTIVTHCAGRTRGIAAADLLRSLGVAEARALRNGCMGWLLSGRALEYGPTSLAERAPWLSCTAHENGPAVAGNPAVTVEQLRAGNPIRYVLDVREPASFGAGHIPGALNLPAGQILIESDTWLATPALPVIVVADAAAQAEWACSHLRALGLPNVAMLHGGYRAWVDHGGTSENSHAATLGDEADLASADKVTVAGYLADTRAWDVIDVRSAGEFGIAHLDGSRCIPRGTLELRPDELRRGQRGVLLVSARGVRARIAAPTVRTMVDAARPVAVLEHGLDGLQRAGASLRRDAPDSGIASRDTPGRVSAAVWRQPLAQTRPLMERYLAWEEALGNDAEG